MCTLLQVSPPVSRSGFALSPGYSSCRDNTQDKFRKEGLITSVPGWRRCPHPSPWAVVTLLPSPWAVVTLLLAPWGGRVLG